MPARLRGVVFCGCLFLLGTVAHSQGSSTSVGPSREAVDRDGHGDPDDPRARAEFEWLRLHDPATGLIPPGIRKKELSFAKTIPTKEEFLRSKGSPAGTIEQVQTSVWNARGPYNVGGRTRALGIDIANPTIILAGGVSGGMWRSTNTGSSWVKTTSDTALQSVSCLAQDTRVGHRGVWYYGTGEIYGNSASASGAPYRGDGVFKSTDDGVTWAQLPSTATNNPQTFDHMFDYVWDIVTDSSNSSQDVVYAATYGGIQRSTDGGSSWTTVLGGTFSATQSYFTDVAITSTGVVYATLSQSNIYGTNSPTRGIWRSPDGVTWTNITPAGFPSTYDRIVIGISRSNENNVYFLGETPGGGTLGHVFYKYSYVSGDGSGAGGSWINRSANIPAFGGAVGDYDSQGSYDMLVKVKPDNDTVVFIGGTNLYRTTDGLADTSNTSWIGGYSTANDVSLYPNQHPDQHAFVFSPTNTSVAFSGNDGGVQMTTNDLGNSGSFPVTWTWLNNGYFTGQFYTIALDHGTSGNNVVIGGLQDNGTWFTNNTNSLSSWVNLFGGDGAFAAIANGRTSYYTSAQDGVIYRLVLDNNGNLLQFTRVDPTGGSGYLFVAPFLLDPRDSVMMYLAGGGTVWRNSNLTGIPLGSNNTTSVNWTQLTNTTLTFPVVVSALGISTSPANRLYYGTSDGRVFRLDSANTGNPTPTNVTGSNFPIAYVNCVAVDPTNADNVIAVFSNYNVISLFSSTNGGTTWTDIAGNLEQFPDGSGDGPSCRWATVLPGIGVYVGTSTGIYSTAALNGTSTVWAQEGSSNVGNVVVDMLDARLADGVIVAGTHGNGVYSTTVTAAPPSTPVLASPANGAVGEPTTLVLSWNASAGASSYRLQVATDSLFASLVFDDSTITTTSKSVGPLSSNTRYFWRVDAKNPYGTSAYSTSRSFTTVIAPPAAPVLLAPANGALNQATALFLRWGSSATATSYHLQLSTDSLFASLVLNDSGLVDTSLQASSLANNTKFYWHVSAKNSGGTSPYSSARVFTTILPTPVLVSPLDGASNRQPTLTLAWMTTPGAGSYHLQVSTDSLFASTAFDDSAVADTFRSVGPLGAGETFYWRVEAKNGLLSSAWSAKRRFSTVSGPPVAPVLLSPPDGAANEAVPVTLAWGTSPGALSYAFEIASDSAFASLVAVDTGLTDTVHTSGPLLTNTIYYWRASAENQLGSGLWSPPFHFTTSNLTTVQYTVQNRWNMISVPLVVPDYRKITLYPTAISNAFEYQGSYRVEDTLQNGIGYWLKFDSAQSIGISGTGFSSDSVDVTAGWNLIGSLSIPIPAASIGSAPAGIISTSFYGYAGSYVVVDTLLPSEGYWVKVSQSGRLGLSNGARVLPKQQIDPRRLSRIVFSDARQNQQSLLISGTEDPQLVRYFEMPPAAPEQLLDVRFANQGMLAVVNKDLPADLQVSLSAAYYPITVELRSGSEPLAARLVIDGREVPISDSSTVRLDRPPSHLEIQTGRAEAMPTQYVLDQNYPNPFNPSTVIRYGLPRVSHVSLGVYNLLGERVAVLVDRDETAGTHEVAFAPTGLASGLYYYRLAAGGAVLTRTLMFLK